MARLLKRNGAGEPEVLELNLGVNRFGRDPDNHFTINHTTVSAHHCDIILTAEAVLLRDCNSTNGTFLNGQPVHQAVLAAGQILRLGDVELLVETTDVTIAIPAIERPRPAPARCAARRRDALPPPRRSPRHAPLHALSFRPVRHLRDSPAPSRWQNPQALRPMQPSR